MPNFEMFCNQLWDLAQETHRVEIDMFDSKDIPLGKLTLSGGNVVSVDWERDMHDVYGDAGLVQQFPGQSRITVTLRANEGQVHMDPIDDGNG